MGVNGLSIGTEIGDDNARCESMWARKNRNCKENRIGTKSL